MSKASKRKYVTREVLDEFLLPEGSQIVVKVLASRGNNLHEIETENGEKFLVTMPTKYRKNVWIKRGDFVLVDPIDEGDKVKAEIVQILYPQQIKYIRDEGLWPVNFTEKPNEENAALIPDDMLPPSSEDEDEDAGAVIRNPNWRPLEPCDDTNSEESSADDGDDDDTEPDKS